MSEKRKPAFTRKNLKNAVRIFQFLKPHKLEFGVGFPAAYQPSFFSFSKIPGRSRGLRRQRPGVQDK